MVNAGTPWQPTEIIGLFLTFATGLLGPFDPRAILGIITLTKHPPNLVSTTAPCDEAETHGAGAPGISIEITPKMIEAGILAAREHCLGEDLSELVRKIFIAMVVEALG
jgi:hypothetical protein